MTPTTTTLGPFTVTFRVSLQHPAGLYYISRNGVEIGRAASMPDEDDCRRMADRHAAEQRDRKQAADLDGALKQAKNRIRPTPMEFAMQHALVNAPGHGLAVINPASRRRGQARSAIAQTRRARERGDA